MSDKLGSFDKLLAERKPGHALPGPFYSDGEVFERDISLLQKHWTYAAHVSEVVNCGDYIVVELGDESAIIIRSDREIRAFSNVCRHRGSRICEAGAGNAQRLMCPYHAWVYRLDGTLQSARQMGPDFNPADHSLVALPIQIDAGLIFISFTEHPPLFDKANSALSMLDQLYGWSNAKVAARKHYTINANWKLALENYHECYHCAPAHTEFSVVHALSEPPAMRQASDRDWRARSENAGRVRLDIEHWPSGASKIELVRIMHSSLKSGCISGSRTGAPAAPLMPAVPRHDGGCTFLEIGMLMAGLAYDDHAVLYRFNPRAPLLTEMDVFWLVHPDAVAGTDYNPDDLCWLWDVTSIADKKIIEANQAGVKSRHYRPGRYSHMEQGACAYVDHYLAAASDFDT